MHFRLVICIITGHCSAHKQMQLQAQRKVNLRQMPRMSSSCLVQCALQARHLYHHWTLQCSQANETASSKDSQPQTNASNVIILFSAMHFRLVICIITGHCSAHKQMQLQAHRTVNLRQMPRMSSSSLVQSTSGSSSVSSLDTAVLTSKCDCKLKGQSTSDKCLECHHPL